MSLLTTLSLEPASSGAALPRGLKRGEEKKGGIPGGYHGDESADKAEVGEVVRVDGGGRVDLQAVIVLPSILKQTVHRVEHLMGQEEKPLSVGEERTEQWEPLHSSWGSAGSDRPPECMCPGRSVSPS